MQNQARTELRKGVQHLGGRILNWLSGPLGRLKGRPSTVGGKRHRGRNEAQQLHEVMISGFGKAAAKRLELLKVNRRSQRVGDAAWALAIWYSSIGDHERALDHLVMRRLALKRDRPSAEHLALQVRALLSLGRLEDAEKTVTDSIARRGEIPELCLCAANVFAANPRLSPEEKDQLRLAWLNKPLLAKGLAPIEMKDPSKPLVPDNIGAPTAKPSSRSGEAKVSVLMPAYNAEDTIAYAMESVLNQTWRNLELIVVDDGSTDDTWSVIQSMAAQDTRVIPVRHAMNRGAYSARNAALLRATGDFITVNDADDWSHPERIAVQVTDLLDNDHVLNTTMLIRAQSNLDVFIKPDGGTRFQNYSSLMTKREHVVDLGGWDECRMGADAELYERLLAKLDANKAMIHRDTYFSIAAARGDSLTRRQDLGIATVRYGPRREYIEAYTYWHRLESSKATPDWAMHPGKRRFPIPRICKLAPEPISYDILLVSDFSLPGGTTADNVNMLMAFDRLKLRCACFHWPRLDSAGCDVNEKIRRLLHEGIADSVVSAEEVECRLVIVNHPPILSELPDMRPVVRTEACVIAINQPAVTHTEGGRAVYELANIIENARTAFGVAPTLAPISPVVRRILGPTADGTTIADLDWTPIVDTEQFRRSASSWDGSRSPIMGRHCRDHKDKWPSDAEKLRLAYCADTGLDVRLLGGVEVARYILGELPSNWTVLPFDSADVREFLLGLDFFVHYPHEHWIEAFGRAPMEAMATGVPTILPPHFEETFGDAAVYAKPEAVLSTIQALWADREAYEAQISRGYAFVESRCSLAKFEERIRPFLQLGQTRRANRTTVPSATEFATYWEGRKDLVYYQVVKEIVETIGGDSILDVGSGGCPYLEWFPAKHKASVDILRPYASSTVRGIPADFLQWRPDRHYDVVLCLQVLEHVKEAERFAKKLLEAGKTVIVTVPYKWAKVDDTAIAPIDVHVHDPIDERKLFSWFEQEPSFSKIAREQNGRERLVQVYGAYPDEQRTRAAAAGADDATRIRFSSSHVRSEYPDGCLVVEIEGAAGLDTIHFSVPPDFFAHNDLVAAALATLCGRKFSRIEFDFPISNKCRELIALGAEAEVCATGSVNERQPGENISLNFSGGLDSLATSLLAPGKFKLVSFDFGGKYASERAWFEQLSPDAICRTDFRDRRYNKGHNPATHYVYWTYFGAASILFADYLRLGGTSFGTIFETAPRLFRLPQSMQPTTDPFFAAAGLKDVTFTEGLTEFGTAKIMLALGPTLIDNALESLAPRGTEKRLRKELLIAAVRHANGGPRPNFEDYSYPRAKIPLGTSYTADFVIVYFVKRYGFEVVSRWIDGLEKLDRSLLDRINVDWYLKFNPCFLPNLCPALRPVVMSNLQTAGIDLFCEADWESYRLTRALLEQHYPALLATAEA